MKKNKLTNKPKISNKQTEIILLLYKFRFLNTHQLQILLNHKNPSGISKWLQDLIKQGYIKRHYERKSFLDNTKPAIFYLASKSVKLIQTEKSLSTTELEYIYKESYRSQKFKIHNILVTDIYLYLLSQKKESEQLKFFTKNELIRYKYFPTPLPDAFITISTEELSRHYFLDVFDDYTPNFVIRNRVKYYLRYAEDPNWAENTENAVFPSNLLVLPNQPTKKHINLYTKSLIEKSIEDTCHFYLTSIEELNKGDKSKNIWGKV